MFDLQAFLRQQSGATAVNKAPLISIGDAWRRQADSGREFLVTNGLGSYASAGLWGENSRKYHGLFVAALRPPVERTVMLSHVDEVVTVNGGIPVELSTNLWRSSTAPHGYQLIEQFTIYPCPTWVFVLPDGYLIKQVTMVPGKQQLVVGYSWNSLTGRAAALSLALIANFRNFHTETRGSEQWQFEQTVLQGQIGVRAFDGAQSMQIRFDRGSYRQEPEWYLGYRWPRETERGLNDVEDCFRLGFIDVTLAAGEALSLVVELSEQQPERVDSSVATITEAVRAVHAHQTKLLEKAANPDDAFQRQAVIAADQFVVHRDSTDGASVIAGYHWFNDWGRDSMISLPGLTLATGRSDIARSILSTFSRYESEGMLPNNFPDSGEAPAYNTSDATFWWAWALHQYFAHTGDLSFVRDQLAGLGRVVEWHKRGTRHKLRLDPCDGLISGGENGVQLTWMDAKVGDYVVTPRQGKAVEICALWYNFLRVLADMYRKCGAAGLLDDKADGERKACEYDALADAAAKGLEKFWNDEKSCLYDVIADDGKGDASVRPNQLIALSLPYTAVSKEHGAKILSVVEKQLLTPFGLRTLSPDNPEYKGAYGCGKAQANQYDRDVTYHQGTVWPWLFGPWVEARLQVHGETADNANFMLKQLEPVTRHLLSDAGLGSVSEIFDGDAPYTARGCVAQAWSVAELLRVRKRLLELAATPAKSPLAAAN